MKKEAGYNVRGCTMLQTCLVFYRCAILFLFELEHFLEADVVGVGDDVVTRRVPCEVERSEKTQQLASVSSYTTTEK